MSQPERNTRETILVVEDDALVREAVRVILERAGFCVLVAGNSTEAIRAESVTEGTIHLLLSDVMMPDMSGPVVPQILKKHRPEMRVILMSGYADGSILLMDQGWHFIQKPLLAAELVARVNEALRTSERGQGNDYLGSRIELKTSTAGA